jgi:hypothetical protein
LAANGSNERTALAILAKESVGIDHDRLGLPRGRRSLSGLHDGRTRSRRHSGGHAVVGRLADPPVESALVGVCDGRIVDRYGLQLVDYWPSRWLRRRQRKREQCAAMVFLRGHIIRRRRVLLHCVPAMAKFDGRRLIEYLMRTEWSRNRGQIP